MRSLHFFNNNALDMCGRIAYFHNTEKTATTAYEIDEAALIQILLPRTLGVVSVKLNLYNESLSQRIERLDCEWTDFVDGYDIYESALDIEKLGVGLYFFSAELDTQYGRLYSFADGDNVRLSYTSGGKMFQLSVSDFRYGKCESTLGGTIYHIFVDRFNRGGDVTPKNGVIMDRDWRVIPEFPQYPGAPLKNNHFYGGTLWGIIDKLDYISSLGVNTIYLSPIFDATSNHKYDTADYKTVDSMFGGDEALSDLINKAREYGIGIILDGVFNHTGSDSIYFNKYGNYSSVGAYQSKKSKYYNWYEFQEYPDKYTCWWGIDILPRIHPDKAECRSYFVGRGGVISKYAKMGISGFRLDVADELSDDFISEIKQALNKYNKQSVLYGEVWEDASNKIAYDTRKKYYLGQELDGVMNYPIRKGIIDFLTNSDVGELRYALTDVTNNAPKRIRDLQMNLLGTHDTVRILTALGGEKPQGRSNEYLSKKRMNDLERGIAKRRLRMAYAILATLPGIPTIFYGDEAGLEGYHDPFNRMPYPWGKEDVRLVDYFRKIGNIRKTNSVYKDGEFKLLYLVNNLLIFARIEDGNSYITVANNSNMPFKIAFSEQTKSLLGNAKKASNNEFTMQAYSAEIYKTLIDTEIAF